MNATEEWLRYIESKILKQEYNIEDYSNDNKLSEQFPTDSSN